MQGQRDPESSSLVPLCSGVFYPLELEKRSRMFVFFSPFLQAKLEIHIRNVVVVSGVVSESWQSLCKFNGLKNNGAYIISIISIYKQ